MPDQRTHLNWPQTRAHQALRSPGNTVCIPWGRGIGKTWYIRYHWYESVALFDGQLRAGALTPFRGVRIAHVMPTFKQCKDVNRELVEHELLARDGEWFWLGAKVDRTTWHFTFPGGSWLQWFGTREANRSRGLRCDDVTADEGDDIDPGVLDAIARPWFSEPWSFRRMLIGGTPRRGRYGLLYREHKTGLDGETARRTELETVTDITERQRIVALRRCYSFHATYRDSPETVDAQYVLEQKAKTPPEVFKREWECDFDSAEGLVYSVFREGFHVREPDPQIRFSEYLVGVDHGYEDPGVFVVIGVQGNGRDAVLWVLDEVYQTHQAETWWVEQARAIERAHSRGDVKPRWYADPSQPARIVALAKEGGVGSRIVPGMNAIEDGVAAVVDRFAVRLRQNEARCKACDSIGCAACRATGIGYARLYVSPKCKNTIRELGAYRRRRDPKNPDITLDAIEDRHNHSMDALRYAVFTRFGGPSHGRVTTGPGWGG